MNKRTQRSLLEQMRKAINSTMEEDTGAVIVEREDDCLVLAWEGLYDWASAVSCGLSLFAGEFEDCVSRPANAKIQKVINACKASGFFFEAETPSTLSVAV